MCIIFCYMEEYYGDAAASIHLSGLYAIKLQVLINDLNKDIHRTTAISTERINAEFTLPDNDPAFIQLRELVEKKMRDAVLSFYGLFSTFTAPLLSQSLLS